MIILEIRGDSNSDFNLVIDESLPRLRYVNFESIHISSSETLKRRTDIIDPSENFDYVPYSEKMEYNVTLEIEEEIKIVPYDVYKLQMQKSRAVSFYGWTELTVLRIHQCKLSELEWEMFDGLEKLQHLSLEHNDLKIVPPFAFYGVPHIKTLSLARNNILDLNYRALAGLLDLIWLDLSFNNITKLSELTFPPFPKLKYLDMRYNPVKYIFPSTFAIMNNTRVLYLGDYTAPLVLTQKQTFQSLSELRYLSISNIQIRQLTQSIFQGLNNLNTLKLRGHIKYIEYDAFSDLPKLKQLILKDCEIEELSMDALFGLSELEIIDLSNNKLTLLPPGIFDDKKNLNEIYLQNNSLTQLPKGFFNGITAKLVRLTRNPWLCTCDMNDWKQSLTNKVRRGRISTTCISSSKTEMCKTNEVKYNYVYDMKVSPRCDGGPEQVIHRNVYYVLRKNLNCNLKKAIAEHERMIRQFDKNKIAIKYKQIKQHEIEQEKLHKTTDRKFNMIKAIDLKIERQQKMYNKYMKGIALMTHQRKDNPNIKFHKIKKNGSENDDDDDNNLNNSL